MAGQEIKIVDVGSPIYSTSGSSGEISGITILIEIIRV